MLKIRLTRTGRKNRPHYRLVVAEHSAPIQGKFVAILGSYDPRNKNIQLKKDEIVSWMDKGAKPTNTVAKLLKKEGIKHKSIVIVEFHRKPKTEVKAEEKPIEKKPESEEKPESETKPISQPEVENGPSQTESANREQKS